MSAPVQASEGAELPSLTEAELVEIDGLVARAPGHVEGARATLREQHEMHAREQEREAAEHWEIGTRYAGTELRLAIARAEALALASRLLTDLRRARARIADLEAQFGAGAEAHREDGAPSYYPPGAVARIEYIPAGCAAYRADGTELRVGDEAQPGEPIRSVATGIEGMLRGDGVRIGVRVP